MKNKNKPSVHLEKQFGSMEEKGIEGIEKYSSEKISSVRNYLKSRRLNATQLLAQENSKGINGNERVKNDLIGAISELSEIIDYLNKELAKAVIEGR